MENTASSKKRLLGLGLGILVVIIFSFIPPSENLSKEGIMALGIMLGAVCLWVLESLPAGITGLLAVVMMVVLGVTPIGSAFAGFGASTVYFTIVIFSLSIIVTKSSIGYRIISAMLKWGKKDSRKLVLAFMIAAALLSTIMSNMSVTAMFMGLTYTIIHQIDAKPGKSNLIKCLLIGIPVATLNGGMATPAGSSSNILVIGLYEQFTGQTIGFLDWTIVGLPLAIVLTPMCWFFITLILKPEPITEADLQGLQQKLETGSLTTYDKKVLLFLIVIPVLWIIGNWVPVLNVTVVIIIGLALMFLPGINLMTWDEFQKGVPWTVPLMMGAVLSLGGIVGATGGIAYITDAFLNSSVMNLGVIMVMLIALSFVYFTNAFLPVGPALIGLFIAPLMGICVGAGISAAIPGMVMSFTTSGCYLMPFNPNNLITYNGGYYTAGDMFKTGLIPSVILMVVCTLWTVFITGVLGIA